MNSDTLNACSLDSFCSPRRLIIFGRLVDELHGTVVPPTSKVSNGGWATRPPQEEPQRVVPTELDTVTVNVEFMGMVGVDSQSMISRPDLVTVTDLTFEPTSVSVNITDLKVNHA